VHPAIFENELHGWHTDEAGWPRGRDFAMCKEWFEVELHSVVEDLCDSRSLMKMTRSNFWATRSR